MCDGHSGDSAPEAGSHTGAQSGAEHGPHSDPQSGAQRGTESGGNRGTPTPGDTSAGRARLTRRLILGYQNCLSPLKLGPSCRFEPTCSAYALTALSRHGLIKGVILSVGRLARCGPWHPGGWDPVPPARRRTKK